LGSEKAMNSTAPTSRPSAAEIERMIREGVPPGKYLVRVMWDGNLQNTGAQLTRSDKVWFAPLEDAIGLLKDRKAYLDGVGFNAESVNTSKPGEYSIIVYRTEDVKASMVLGTKENLIAEVEKSKDFALRPFKSQPKEFWDKVFDIDFEPHLQKLKAADQLNNSTPYIKTLPKDLQEPIRARILMFTKMGANENYGGKGYTLSPDKVDAKGKILSEAERIRVREYLIDNQKIVDSPSHIIIKIK
jgi:hypothetical protein